MGPGERKSFGRFQGQSPGGGLRDEVLQQKPKQFADIVYDLDCRNDQHLTRLFENIAQFTSCSDS